MKKCTLNKIYHKSMYMYVEYRYFQERKSIFQAQFFLLKIFNGDIMVKLVKLVSSKYPLSLTKAPYTWVIEISKRNSEIIYFRGLTFNYIVRKIIVNISLTERLILKHPFAFNLFYLSILLLLILK